MKIALTISDVYFLFWRKKYDWTHHYSPLCVCTFNKHPFQNISVIYGKFVGFFSEWKFDREIRFVAEWYIFIFTLDASIWHNHTVLQSSKLADTMCCKSWSTNHFDYKNCVELCFFVKLDFFTCRNCRIIVIFLHNGWEISNIWLSWSLIYRCKWSTFVF